MRFNKVLLVTPDPHADWRGIVPHLGQAYLAQFLQEMGIQHDILDLNLGYKLKDIKRKIEVFKPDLVGMSLISFEYKRFYDILLKIKSLYPDLKTIVGGPHVTIMREQVLQECPAIDFGVVYEGENTLTELCQGEKALKDIKGLLFKNEQEIVYTGDRKFAKDLDKIPWPRYEKFELNKYVQERVIYTSRGCPHLCIFCPNRIISPLYRPRSPEHVVDEMEYWYKKGIRQFNFDDDNFNLIRERVFAICDEIERRGLTHIFIRCSNGIRADKVDRKMLIRMRDVGFRYIAFGADAGNNKMLKLVKKDETIEEIEQAVRDACELGYDVKLLFVIGTPYETREDVEDKVRLTKRYPIQEVHFYNTIPTPGTELFNWVKDNNLFLVQPEEYLNYVSFWANDPVFETPELPKQDRLELFQYLARIRKKVHREAMLRILRNSEKRLITRLSRNSIIGNLLASLLVNPFIEKLFYQKVLIRKIINRFRYGWSIR
jgi:anaerobic magnesium-protoporphyrin IX monomethyl ester cyclase